MALVYKAKQRSLERIVAVKILRPDLTSDPTAVVQFKLEANSVANLKHPNILMIHEAGSTEGVHYFIMEYVSAYSVSTWLQRKGRLTESDALTVADAVARALQYAWEKAGLVHCDIKPGNILVDEDGVVKLADFSGLSRTNLSEEAQLLQDVTIGTPNYMAPEQVRGFSTLDFRADIYALGAVIYHLVTGRLPFETCTEEEAMQQQVEGHLEDPLKLNPAISPHLALLVEKMMVKDRDQRYGSWDAVVADIGRVRAGQAPNPPLPYPGSSTVRREMPAATVPRPAPAPRFAGSSVFAPVGVTPAQAASIAPHPIGTRARRRKLLFLISLAAALLLLDVGLISVGRVRKHRTRPPKPPVPGIAATNATPLPPPTAVAVVAPDPGPTNVPPAPPAVTPTGTPVVAAVQTQAVDAASSNGLPATAVVAATDTNAAGTFTGLVASATNGVAAATNAAALPPPATSTTGETVVAASQAESQREQKLMELREYLKLVVNATGLCQRRAYAAAIAAMKEWHDRNTLNPLREQVAKDVAQLEMVAALYARLENVPRISPGIVIQVSPELSGEAASIRGGRVTVMRRLATGTAQYDVELARVSDAEVGALLQALDAPQHPLNLARFLAASVQFDAATAQAERASSAGLPADDIKAWIAEWARAVRNVQADRMLDDIKTLTVNSRYAEADAQMKRLKNMFADSDIVQWGRTAEIASLDELLERMAGVVMPDGTTSSTGAVAGTTSDPATPATGEDLDTSADIVTLTPEELTEGIGRYDKKIVRLRFRFRSDIVRELGGQSRTEIGMQAQIPGLKVVFPTDAVKWFQGVSRVISAADNRVRVVYGTVDAQTQTVRLLGRTRKAQMGGLGSEFSW